MRWGGNIRYYLILVAVIKNDDNDIIFNDNDIIFDDNFY